MRGKYKIKRKSLGLVHCLATCEFYGCGWENGDYTIASLMATEHAKKFAHTVRIEKGFAEKVEPVKKYKA